MNILDKLFHCLIDSLLRTKKVIILVLVFQFLTIPLYPVITVSQVYAQTSCQQLEAMGEVEPGYCEAQNQRIQPPTPVYHEPEAPAEPAPDPVYFYPPVQSNYQSQYQSYYQGSYQSSYQSLDPNPEAEAEQLPDTTDIPQATTYPDLIPETVAPEPENPYAFCINSDIVDDDVCYQLYVGGGAPSGDGSGVPASDDQPAAGGDETPWWEIPGVVASDVWEWVKETAEETGEAVEDVAARAGDYVASRFGGGSSSGAPAAGDAPVAGPQPQDPAWIRKIAEAESDRARWEGLLLDPATTPEQLAQERAALATKLGLPADATPEQVIAALDANSAVEGVRVQGPDIPQVILTVDCLLDPTCTPDATGARPPSLAAQAAGAVDGGCVAGQALRNIKDENGEAKVQVDLSCRPDVTDTAGQLALVEEATKAQAQSEKAQSDSTVASVLGIGADFVLCSSVYRLANWEKCAEVDSKIIAFGKRGGSSIIASTVGRNKFYGDDAHNNNCQNIQYSLAESNLGQQLEDFGCYPDTRSNEEREAAIRAAIDSDSTSRPDISEGLKNAGLPETGWRAQKIQDIAQEVGFDLKNPNADPSRRDNFIARIIASDPEASAVIIENVFGIPLTAIQNEAISRRICERDVSREICSLAIYDPQSRIDQEVRPRAAYLGLSEEEVAALNADAQARFPNFQPAETNKVKQYAQARYDAYSAFRGNDDYEIQARKQRIAQIMGLDPNDPELAQIEQTYNVWNTTADQILAETSAGQVYGKAKQDTQTQAVIGMAGLAFDGGDFIDVGVGLAKFFITKKALSKLVGRNGIKTAEEAAEYVAQRGGSVVDVDDVTKVPEVQLAQGRVRPGAVEPQVPGGVSRPNAEDDVPVVRTEDVPQVVVPEQQAVVNPPAAPVQAIADAAEPEPSYAWYDPRRWVGMKPEEPVAQVPANQVPDIPEEIASRPTVPDDAPITPVVSIDPPATPVRAVAEPEDAGPFAAVTDWWNRLIGRSDEVPVAQVPTSQVPDVTVPEEIALKPAAPDAPIAPKVIEPDPQSAAVPASTVTEPDPPVVVAPRVANDVVPGAEDITGPAPVRTETGAKFISPVGTADETSPILVPNVGEDIAEELDQPIKLAATPSQVIFEPAVDLLNNVPVIGSPLADGVRNWTRPGNTPMDIVYRVVEGNAPDVPLVIEVIDPPSVFNTALKLGVDTGYPNRAIYTEFHVGPDGKMYIIPQTVEPVKHWASTHGHHSFLDAISGSSSDRFGFATTVPFDTETVVAKGHLVELDRGMVEVRIDPITIREKNYAKLKGVPMGSNLSRVFLDDLTQTADDLGISQIANSTTSRPLNYEIGTLPKISEDVYVKPLNGPGVTSADLRPSGAQVNSGFLHYIGYGSSGSNDILTVPSSGIYYDYLDAAGKTHHEVATKFQNADPEKYSTINVGSERFEVLARHTMDPANKTVQVNLIIDGLKGVEDIAKLQDFEFTLYSSYLKTLDKQLPAFDPSYEVKLITSYQTNGQVSFRTLDLEGVADAQNLTTDKDFFAKLAQRPVDETEFRNSLPGSEPPISGIVDNVNPVVPCGSLVVAQGISFVKEVKAASSLIAQSDSPCPIRGAIDEVFSSPVGLLVPPVVKESTQVVAGLADDLVSRGQDLGDDLMQRVGLADPEVLPGARADVFDPITPQQLTAQRDLVMARVGPEIADYPVIMTRPGDDIFDVQEIIFKYFSQELYEKPEFDELQRLITQYQKSPSSELAQRIRQEARDQGVVLEGRMPGFAAVTEGEEIKFFAVKDEDVIDMANRYAQKEGINREFNSIEEARAFVSELADKAILHEYGHVAYKKLSPEQLAEWQRIVDEDPNLREQVINIHRDKHARVEDIPVEDEAFADYFIDALADGKLKSRLADKPEAVTTVNKFIDELPGVTKIDEMAVAPCPIPGVTQGFGLVKEASAACTPQQIDELRVKNEGAQKALAEQKRLIDEAYAKVDEAAKTTEEVLARIYTFEYQQRQARVPKSVYRESAEYDELIRQLDESRLAAGNVRKETVDPIKGDYVKAKTEAVQAREELDSGLIGRGEAPLGYTDPQVRAKTQQFLDEDGLGDDDVVYRSVSTEFVRDGYVYGVLEPTAELRDFYTNGHFMNAWELEGTGLNVLKKKSIKNGGYFSPKEGQVLVAIKVGDLKEIGAKFYPDVTSSSGANAAMVELPGTRVKVARVYDNPVKNAYYDGVDWVKKSFNDLKDRLTPASKIDLESEALPPCSLSLLPSSGFSFVKEAKAQTIPCPTKYQRDQGQEVLGEVLNKYTNGKGVTVEEFPRFPNRTGGGMTFSWRGPDDIQAAFSPNRGAWDRMKFLPDQINELENKHYNYVITSDGRMIVVDREMPLEMGEKHQQLAGRAWELDGKGTPAKPDVGIVWAGEMKVEDGRLLMDLESGTMFDKAKTLKASDIWRPSPENLEYLENLVEGITGRRPLAVKRVDSVGRFAEARLGDDIAEAELRAKAAAERNLAAHPVGVSAVPQAPTSAVSSVTPSGRTPRLAAVSAGYPSGRGVTYSDFRARADQNPRIFTVDIFPFDVFNNGFDDYGLKPKRRSGNMFLLNSKTADELEDGQVFRYVVTDDDRVILVPLSNRAGDADLTDQLAGAVWGVKNDGSATKPGVGIVFAGDAKVVGGELVMDVTPNETLKILGVKADPSADTLTRLEDVVEVLSGRKPLGMASAVDADPVSIEYADAIARRMNPPVVAPPAAVTPVVVSTSTPPAVSGPVAPAAVVTPPASVPTPARVATPAGPTRVELQEAAFEAERALSDAGRRESIAREAASDAFFADNPGAEARWGIDDDMQNAHDAYVGNDPEVVRTRQERIRANEEVRMAQLRLNGTPQQIRRAQLQAEVARVREDWEAARSNLDEAVTRARQEYAALNPDVDPTDAVATGARDRFVEDNSDVRNARIFYNNADRQLVRAQARAGYTPNELAYAEALEAENNARVTHGPFIRGEKTNLGGPEALAARQAEIDALQAERVRLGEALSGNSLRRIIVNDGRPVVPVEAPAPLAAVPEPAVSVVSTDPDDVVVVPSDSVGGVGAVPAGGGSSSADGKAPWYQKGRQAVEIFEERYPFGAGFFAAGGPITAITAVVVLTPKIYQILTGTTLSLAPSLKNNNQQPREKPAAKPESESLAPDGEADTQPSVPDADPAPQQQEQPRKDLTIEAQASLRSVIDAHGKADFNDEEKDKSVELCQGSYSVLANRFNDGSYSVLKNYGKVPGVCGNPLSDGSTCTPEKEIKENFTQCGGSIGLENLTHGQNYQITRSTKCSIPDGNGKYSVNVSYSKPEPVRVAGEVCKEKEIAETKNLGESCESDVECKNDAYCSNDGKRVCVFYSDFKVYVKDRDQKLYDDCVKVATDLDAIESKPTYIQYSCYIDEEREASGLDNGPASNNRRKVRVYPKYNPAQNQCVLMFADIGPGVSCPVRK